MNDLDIRIRTHGTTMRMPRSRGAVTGFWLILLGLWGALNQPCDRVVGSLAERRRRRFTRQIPPSTYNVGSLMAAGRRGHPIPGPSCRADSFTR